MGALIFLRKASQNAHHTHSKNFQIFCILNIVYNRHMPKIKMGGKTVKLPYAKGGGKIPKYGKGGSIKPSTMPRKIRSK